MIKDPVIKLNFIHTKEVILHALSINMVPNLILAKAIKSLEPGDALDIAP